MSTFKRLGDEAMRAKRYGQAIDFYTRALNDTPPNGDQSTEDKRTVLANRTLAYIKREDIYGALPDCELALSPEYTTTTSPKALTAKCHYRRAKIRLVFAMYEQALEDYQAFVRIRQEIGVKVVDTDKELLAQITTAMSQPVTKKLRLIRAVQARDIILAQNFRGNFPKHPTIKRRERTKFDEDDSDEDDDFDDEEDFDEGPLTDSQDRPDRPLTVLFAVAAPYLEDPDEPRETFKGLIGMQENFTLADYIPGMFMGMGMALQGPGAHTWTRKAAPYTMLSEIQVFLITHRRRFLKIPQSTRVADIWAGAKWPRDGPLAFEDLIPTPRLRPHEIDGACLISGYNIELYLVGNEDAPYFVQAMLSGLSDVENI